METKILDGISQTLSFIAILMMVIVVLLGWFCYNFHQMAKDIEQEERENWR